MRLSPLRPKTRWGRTFRVKGRGAARADGSKGDLLVAVNVVVPQRIDDAAKEALEAFRTATKDADPRAGLMERAKGD